MPIKPVWVKRMAAGAAVVTGCSWQSPPAPVFEVEVDVQSDPGRPVGGAQIGWGEQALGKTDPAGRMGLRIRGREGQRIVLAVTCPDGFASPRDPLELTLRQAVALPRRPRLPAHCPPTRRRVVVAVRADRGANLPLLHLGSEVSRTDADGAAHVLLELPPGEQLQLQLDTRTRPDLLPQSPSVIFEVGDGDAVFLFDQAIARRPRSRRILRRPKGPERI